MPNKASIGRKLAFLFFITPRTTPHINTFTYRSSQGTFIAELKKGNRAVTIPTVTQHNRHPDSALHRQTAARLLPSFDWIVSSIEPLQPTPLLSLPQPASRSYRFCRHHTKKAQVLDNTCFVASPPLNTPHPSTGRSKKNNDIVVNRLETRSGDGSRSGLRCTRRTVGTRNGRTGGGIDNAR